MQLLNAAPRQALTAARVLALLQADDITVGVGMERVDNTGQAVADLSEFLDGGSVSWSGSVDVHRECSLQVSTELGWDRDRIRPYMDLTSQSLGISARWWLGVFILHTTGVTAGGGDVRTTTGYDLLRLLSCPVGDTWAVEAGANVLDECRRLVAATSFGPRVLFDTAKRDATFTVEMVWPLIPTGGGSVASTTWLQVLSEMLTSIGYERPWVDEAGQLRSAPIVAAAARPTEFTLTTDVATSILGPLRTRKMDLLTIPNAWIFVASNWDLDPIDGDGLYLPPDNTGTGPTSIQARNGHRVVAVRSLTAQVQADLLAQAGEIIASDMRAASVRDLAVNPLPAMGHNDLYALVDPDLGGSVRAIASAWTLNLDGSDGSLTVEEVAS